MTYPEAIERWTTFYPKIAEFTATAKTNKGYHVLLRLKSPPPGNYAPAYFQNEPLGETRGQGGYIVVPPSIHGSGHHYEWIRPPCDGIAEVESLEAVGITKKGSGPQRTGNSIPLLSIHTNGNHSAYAKAAFKDEIEILAHTNERNRNSQLNKSAFALGQLIGADHLTRSEVEWELERTALAIGLDEQETRRTIRSGIEAGLKKPRHIPAYSSSYESGRHFTQKDREAELDEPSNNFKNFETLMAKLTDLKTSNTEIIQEWVWTIVDDAAQLARADYGRFKDALHAVGLTRTWLKTWNGTVWQRTEELRQQQKRENATKAASFSTHSGSGFPCIVCNGRHLREIVADSMSALWAKNNVDPFIFQRGNLLTRIRVDEKERATTEPLTDYSLRGILARCADFVNVKMQGDELVQIPMPPPMDIINDILNLSEWESIPPLEGIAAAPVVTKAGTLDLQPGYQSKSRLCYLPQKDLVIGDITPTDRNIEAAKNLLLDDILGDFPFVDEAAKANALALMLLPFVRPYIDGPTPNHIIEAPTEGTGKTLLAMTVTYPYAGTDSIPPNDGVSR
ncbi:MAG: bifunctional DNA primase/polymerase [Anaerolineae bacterium]|nr:bifunctional DNA primase/polymerase [Anaerolineae bacterium]